MKVFLILLFLISCGRQIKEKPNAVKGIIDLKGWNFERDGKIDLKGEWTFHKKIVEKDVKGGSFLKVPGSFSKNGYGTYILRVRNLKKQDLSLDLSAVHSAYRLYLVYKGKSRLLLSSGKVGKSRKEEVPQFKKDLLRLPEIEGSFDFVIHISSFHYREGKLTRIFMGSQKQLEWEFTLQNRILFFSIGVLFIISIYHFGLYNQRKNDTLSLYFALLCGLISIRMFVVNHFVTWIFSSPSTILFELLRKVDYFTFILAPFFSVLFFNKLMSDDFKKGIKFYKVIMGTFFLVVLIVPVRIFSQKMFLVPIQLAHLIFCFALLVGAIIYAVKGVRFFRLIAMGLIILIAGAIQSILIPQGITRPPEMLSFALVIFVFIQSYILSVIFSEAKELQENYAKTLKLEVNKKTESIKGLVENLGQGFMVIDRKGIIQEGATQITKEFFKTDPEGKKLSEVLQLKDEQKDVFNKWVENIWRGVLSFKDLRPLGPQFFHGENGEYIDLDYKAIYGDKKKIDRVICVATDKTKEIELSKQLEIDKQEAFFITTCLQDPVEFVDLLDETYNLLGAYKIIRDMDEKELFRKFHTLKARYGQFGTKSITDYINEIETAISKGELEKIDERVDRFKNKLKEFVNEHRLIIEVANRFMIDQGTAIQVSDLLSRKESFTSLDQLFSYLRENYLLSDIKEKFERYRPLVEELADEQGKVIDVNIEGDEIRVDVNRYSGFINTSIHLFRNMVDHGIETEDERIEKTKNPRGRITVLFKNMGVRFFIEICDDGAGINPDKIKEKVLEKGLKKEEELKNSDLLDLIFLPGFSTKEEVTDISGRGVGLDAVRAEVESLGGIISVSSKIDEGTTFKIELPILS